MYMCRGVLSIFS